jgi:hypothetical protein
LRPFTFLPASKPDIPPLSVVFTDWTPLKTPILADLVVNTVAAILKYAQ